ncbi:MAG: cation:proton antiporter [Nanoarchaeota archaeon]|nr:cation:proton antiporter [Nanoarchaeota archaeon]
MANPVYLVELSWLGALLLIGLICSIISYKIKISNILLLIIVGIGLGNFISFPISFLTNLGVFALIMIIFDSSSRFKIKEVAELYPYALKLVIVFTLMNLIFFSFFTHVLFDGSFTIKGLILSLLFSALMSGTSPDVVLSVLKEKKRKLAELLEFESIINSPITILLPLVIFNLYQGIFEAEIIFRSFLQSIMTGIGTGLFLGLVIFRLMKKKYIENLSPLVIIALVLISYSLAEVLGGSGILSVTTLGIVFGRSILKEKEEIQKFSGIFTNFLKIIMFILLGLVIQIPFKYDFLIKATILFFIYLVVRYVAVSISFKKLNLNKKEKIFMTFNISKGLGVAVVVFMLIASGVKGLEIVVSLSFFFILYSIVLSSVMNRFIDYFLKYDEVKKKIEKIEKKK